LTVSSLVSQNLQSARFAYLSACHTASSRNFSLLDESRHIASSIQQARYPSVVGTLWSVRDQNSCNIAKYVYSWMLSYGSGAILCAEKSAEGLHHAIRKTRQETRRRRFSSDPLAWAPYIHIGV
jgi:CHAT domain-containing protein